MRLLYVSREYTEHDWNFLTRLKEGFQIFYLRMGPITAVRETRPVPAGITVIDWVPLMDLEGPFAALERCESKFRDLIDEVKPKLIHAGPLQLGGFLPARVRWNPFVVVSWGSDLLVEAHQNEEWRAVTELVLSRSDAFLCDSDAVRAAAQTLVRYPDDRIIQFPWGVDLDLFSANRSRELREALGWDDGFVIIVTRSYNIDVLLEAFSLAQSKDSRLRLLCLGGAVKSKVESWARAAGLSSHVHAAGQVNHESVAACFQNSDVYVSCSPSDGTSVSMLEAFACGLPVVASDIPSNREWVTEPDNGWLADPRHSESYALKMLNAARLTENETESMRMNNRFIAESRANWKQNTEALVTSYHRLISSGTPS